MPYAVEKNDGGIVTRGPSGVHGRFPRTQAGYRRAYGQVKIMERAEGRKRRRWSNRKRGQRRG